MNKKFEYIDDNPGSYFGMLVESVENKKELKEDKFVPQDKMSKKAQKELNDKKRGTWGNTNPVTKVQPNKKAYDRKRDSKVVMEESKNLNERELLLKYAGKFKRGDIYKWIGTNTPSLELYPDDFSIDGVKNNLLKDGFKLVDKYDGNRNEDSYLVFTKVSGNDKIIAVILFNDFNVTLQIEVNPEDEETLEYFDESLKESIKLNESSDGWDESKLDELLEILDEIYNLQYEVKNTVRGAYTNAHTYEELGYYVHNLGSNLMDIGDEIMEMEEEDEEDED